MKRVVSLILSFGLAAVGAVALDAVVAPSAEAASCYRIYTGGPFSRVWNDSCKYVMAKLDYRSAAGNKYTINGKEQWAKRSYSQTASIYSPNVITRKYAAVWGVVG